MQKIKQFIESNKGKDFLTILIIILVGLGSFGLGRLSKNNEAGLKIDYNDQKANIIDTIDKNHNTYKNSNYKQENMNKNNSGNFFASTRGSKYYSVSCSAGKTIKLSNRIYFNTKEEAEKAGYELSSSCR